MWNATARRITRRHLQIGLGLLWLLDAGLQAQPYMFSRGFAHDIIGPAGDGQPVAVAAPVHWAASVVASHPVLTDTGFVAVQAALGVLLLWRRSARLALAGSIAWGLMIWWLGEGIGGVAGGVSLLEGSPGAALLYAAVAVVAWPAHDGADQPVAERTVTILWVALWIAGAALGSPSPALVGLYVLVALWAVLGGAWRWLSAIMGAGIAIGAWVTVQSFGELASGQSTDPNTAPLIVLLALALPFAARQRGSAGGREVMRGVLRAPGGAPLHT